MTQSAAPNTPIVILACKVFQNWLEHLLPEGLARGVTFFDYGLHQIPKNLRQTIQTAIDSIEQPSLVVLGYGLCGNGLDAIQAGQHTLPVPLVPGLYCPPAGVLCGVPSGVHAGAGHLLPLQGLAGSRLEPAGREPGSPEKKYGPKKAAFVMDVQYHNYRRLMLVARNPEELAAYRPRRKKSPPTAPNGGCVMKRSGGQIPTSSGWPKSPAHWSRPARISLWSRRGAC